jgi:uncharacterized protein (UPF0335 family)
MASRGSTASEARTLTQRVEALEAELAELRQESGRSDGVPANAWRLAVEKYTGDEDIQSVFRAALKVREADRKQARRRRSTSGRAKK